MATVESVQFTLLNHEGKQLGTIAFSVLPSLPDINGIPALIQQRLQDQNYDTSLEFIQLLEGCEYIYEVDTHESVSFDRSELFIPDDKRGSRGRLRTRLSTGRVEVNIKIGNEQVRPIAFEVRSTKLNYLTDYRLMLEDIAAVSAELLLERFAPSEQRFQFDYKTDAQTIYQRFVFLRGLLQGEKLSAALRYLIATPYVQWESIDESRAPGRGIRGSGALAYELSRAGPRTEWSATPYQHVCFLPHRLRIAKTEETLDNIPNRFVRFALEEWRCLVAGMLDTLQQEADAAPSPVSAPVVRGLREGAALSEYLDDLIRSPIFEDVGALTAFPIENQVLQRKEGYRDVLHAYLLIQLSSALNWTGGEDVFSGGQRNVATLYEYWVFLELARIVSALCDEPLDLRTLVTESNHGLNLVLQKKRNHTLKGNFSRNGRHFSIELCFNQQFSRNTYGTWTKALRPDCSLHIEPRKHASIDDDVWLHFDAKYRINSAEELSDSDNESSIGSYSADLNKMHTYRDAILRAVGAYVIFPGNETRTHRRHHEILPSLGAFPLRPTASGPAEGSAAIRTFLNEVFDHLATQTSQHERARYWQREAIKTAANPLAREAVSFLRAPPADTRVLLGYVKSPKHYAWIQQTKLYNLRADPGRQGRIGLRSDELSAEFVVLYGEINEDAALFRIIGEPQLLTRENLEKLAYPMPGGQVYFCFKVERIPDVPSWWSVNLISNVVLRHRGKRAFGEPIAISWSNLAEL